MQKSKQIIEVAGIEIELTRKKMRSISIRINVPNGEVRASASFRYSYSQIFKFIEQKVDWIRESRDRIIKLRDEGKIKLPPKIISGEEHYFFGKKFPLEVVKNGYNCTNRVKPPQDFDRKDGDVSQKSLPY